jgi:hypothetical protein
MAADASWQDICKLYAVQLVILITDNGLPKSDDALNAEPAFPGVPKGKPGSSGRPDTGSIEWDTSYSRELLGKEFTGIKETFRETEAFYQEKGWSFMK